MGSYLSKKEDKPVPPPPSNLSSNLSNKLFSYENMMWLRKQIWAWILLGIFIMSVFFYIAKGLIVFIGGSALGVYLYSIYGKDDGNNGSNGNNKNVKGNDTIFDNTMSYMKTGVNTINNVINSQRQQPQRVEGFQNNRIFSNIWWSNSR